MSFWKRLNAILRREAVDVKQGLSNLGKSLDAGLARRERELAATPEERIDMILEEQQAGEARFQELTDRVLGTDPEGGANQKPAGADPGTEAHADPDA